MCEFKMQVWNVLYVARWKCRTQKMPKFAIWAHRTTLSGYIFATKAHIDNQKKNLFNSNISPTWPYYMANFGLLAAEICWRVWGTPVNFNGFRVLAALLHGSLVVGSQTLRRWTEGTIYIRQGGHHVGIDPHSSSSKGYFAVNIRPLYGVYTRRSSRRSHRVNRHAIVAAIGRATDRCDDRIV